MRLWWVWILTVSAAVLAADPISTTPLTTAQIAPELRASLTGEYEIDVLVFPHQGDAWSRLARRVSGDAASWREIASHNGADETLVTHRPVRVPFRMLRAPLKRQVIDTLFPQDRAGADGWRHNVIGGRGVEAESLWQIAEWFTGDGSNYLAIRKANPAQGLSTRKGDVVLIPKELLTAAFGGEVEGENAATATTEVRKSEDDPVERATADADASQTVEPSAVGAPSLTYERSVAEPYAVYRLQRGEALYSSVAIRFTGRVFARDVTEILDRIVTFNGIEDVARIPVNFPVKIPMDLLLPEYLPVDDPTRLAREAARRESARLAQEKRARGLEGVHVVLDAGHGGRDVGTTHEGIWESSYVYDVACRLKKILEKKTAAKVSLTTRSQERGYSVSSKNVIEPTNDHYVLTTPPYGLEDPVVGVNLRWYLANSIFYRAMKSGVPREKVIFISIHADSLHPSLRGAMAYIPGERFVKGAYEKTEKVYLARAEVRERPVVRHTARESLIAEGLSQELAGSIMSSFEKSGLQIHPFNPIRDNVVRDGRNWVPAVIRYNLVPTRLLLEVCNLGNEKDRALMKTSKYRQRVAEAMQKGIVGFFGEKREEGGRWPVAGGQSRPPAGASATGHRPLATGH